MFQEFNTSSIQVDFIKQLIATTPLPLYDTIEAGDLLLSGRYYIYQNSIIQCTETGLFNPDALYYFRDNAGYRFVSEGNIPYEEYVPTSCYYDNTLHEYLGRYLLRLKATTGLNLFPFYNCYGGREITGIKIDSFKRDPLTCGIDHIEGVSDPNNVSTWHKVVADSTTVAGFTYLAELSGGYEVVENSASRLVAIPVKFGHTYTIAIESTSMILGRCFFLNDSGNLLTFENGYNNVIDPSSYLRSSIFQCTPTRFSSPVTYTVPLLESIVDTQLKNKLYANEHLLHLVLQLPKNCACSVAVLDGNFVNSTIAISNKNPHNYESGVDVQQTGSSNVSTVVPSLLHYNTGISYAFSDRLLEYLAENVIHDNDPIAGNIRRIQQVMEQNDLQYSKYDRQYNRHGIWHVTLSEALDRFMHANDYQSWSKFDHDGNVNVDVEYLLAKFGGYDA